MSNRNVILVTFDSVRADYCGFLSDEVDTTPTIDSLTSNSIVFEEAIAPGPQTLSSVPAIHTGTPLAVTDHDITDYDQRIARIQDHVESNSTISEIFRENGYSTACVEANPWASKISGLDKGFDTFHDVGGEQRQHVSERFKETPIGPVIRTLSRWYHQDGWFSRWPHFYDRIMSVVNELSEPYFLWVFLLDTHNPYFVGPPDRVESSTIGMYYATLRANSVMGGKPSGTNYKEKLPHHVEKRVKQAYRDSIRSVDRFTNKLLNDLNEDDPVLAIYSDHGEGFGDHGTYGHQHKLYQENIHVPFVIHNAGVTDRISGPVSMLQLPQILQECAGIKSFSPSSWQDDYVFSRTENSNSIAVRGSRWKYIHTSDEEELYDIVDDPKEQTEVSSEQESVLSELRSVRESHLNSLPQRSVSSSNQNSDQLRERLDALGYVG